MARSKVKKEPKLADRIEAYMATTREGYDWDAHWNEDRDAPDDLFQACITTDAVRDSDEYFACGSVAIRPEERQQLKRPYVNATTPIALYRLLYLVRPSSVNFSDMYKTTLFYFRSADKRFLVEVDLFKYEVGLYFYAEKDAVGGKGSGVVAGMPGADNGWHCDDPTGQAFFEMVSTAVGQQWRVYSGNDFEV